MLRWGVGEDQIGPGPALKNLLLEKVVDGFQKIKLFLKPIFLLYRASFEVVAWTSNQFNY